MRHKVNYTDNGGKCSRKPWPHWHFKQFCPANDGPTTKGQGMQYFEADDRCLRCKKLILIEHEIFLFNSSPDAIRMLPGQAHAEWQPCPETPRIEFDTGPNRVAYVWGVPGDGEGHVSTHLDHVGEPVVMVHEGPLADVLWVPCSAATMEYNPRVWLWICQPIAPRNPSTNEWMLSISS